MRPAKATQPAPGPTVTDSLAMTVREFLTRHPRQLPSRLLYDPLGSALFDAICRLPWYGLTAAEMRLLGEHGAAITARVGPLGRIVELGSGNGEKAAALVGARPSSASLDLHLIDISPAALTTATQAWLATLICGSLRTKATTRPTSRACPGSSRVRGAR